MQAINETNSIVILGHWNPHSFSSNWIQEKLCSNKEDPIQIAVPLNFTNAPDAPPYIAFEGIKLILGQQALRILSEKSDLTSLVRCAEISKIILTDLSQTPVSGLGINICFQENDSPEKILAKVIFDDSKKIDSNKFKLISSNVKRTYVLEDKNQLNFEVISNDPNKVTLQFNFHFDIKDTANAIGILGQTEQFYKQAIMFIRDVYDLELVE